MGTSRVIFERLSNEEKESNVRSLNTLIIDLRARLGPRAIIDLRETSHYQILAKELISAFKEHASPSRMLSDKSFATYQTSITELLDYCQGKGMSNNIRLCDIDKDFLISYKRYLSIKYPEKKSATKRRRFGNLLRLLYSAKQSGLVKMDLILPRNLPNLKDGDRIQPYTDSEALDIEAACRTHITSVNCRLLEGKKLLAVGKDPRGRQKDALTGKPIRAWHQISNILWYVANILDGQFYKRHELIGKGHSTFINTVTGANKCNHRLPEIYGYLYPTAFDLIPYFILLAKLTGKNESSIITLKRDCLQKIDDKYYLWYEKLRGSKRLYKENIPNDGQYSPVWLIQELLRITEPLSRLCIDEFKQYLFLGLTIRGHNRESIKPLDPSYVKTQMNRPNGWVDQNNLLNAKKERLKISLRSTRVFHLCKYYKRTGMLSKVSRYAAHTLQNTTVNYLENESMKHHHEVSVIRALQTVKDLTQPLVIADQKEAQNIIKLKILDKEIFSGKQDVFFASCKDFYNKPGGKTNSPCEKPWECFTCPNAVITRHILPRVIAFKNFIDSEKIRLHPEDWNNKFLSVWNIITTHILPKFKNEVIKEAEIAALNEKLYIPLAFKT